MKQVFKKFFSVQHQFRIDSLALNLSDHVLLWVGIALVALALVIRILTLFAKDQLKVKFVLRFYHLTLTIGLLELFWFFLRYENVILFGTHFVAYLLLLIGLVWLGFIFRYRWKIYPSLQEKQRKEQVKLKYL